MGSTVAALAHDPKEIVLSRESLRMARVKLCEKITVPVTINWDGKNTARSSIKQIISG